MLDLDRPAGDYMVRLDMDPDQHRSTCSDHIECGGRLGALEWASDSRSFAFVSSSRDERVWTTSVKRGSDLLNLTRTDVGQDVEVNVRDSDYRWINSDLADGRDVHVEFDLSHSFQDGPIPLYNTIAGDDFVLVGEEIAG